MRTIVAALVVSRFSRSDMTLCEEFRPRLAAGSGLALAGEQRSLDELYVTGSAVADGRLCALSAACGTLLVVDLETRIGRGNKIDCGT